MGSTTEDASVEGNQINYMSEDAFNNLKELRSQMLENNRSYCDLTLKNEIFDLTKYKILTNFTEKMQFEDDSEDLGVTEDLVLLNIK